MMIPPLVAVLSLAPVAAQDASAPAPADPVVAEIVVEAPVETVWAAYTDPAAMRRWQAPSIGPLALRVGARWRTSYDPDAPLGDDDPTVIENEVLAFDPGRMLAVRTVRAPADFPFPSAILDAWTVLYLEPVDGDRTRVVTRMFGFTDAPESARMREFFAWGNAYELMKLAEFLDGSPR